MAHGDVDMPDVHVDSRAVDDEPRPTAAEVDAAAFTAFTKPPPIKNPKRAPGDGRCPAHPNLISHSDCLGAPPARKHATGACCVVPRCAPR